MNTATQHPVSPEEIMAMLDGELSTAESRALLQHLEACAACASVEEQLRSTSEALASWSIPAAPKELDQQLEKRASEIASAQRNVKPPAYGSSRWKPWVFAGAGALAAVAGILFVGLAM
ncbi:MAG: anti-sigma factor, partial [Acidobacteriaceae bacterium]